MKKITIIILLFIFSSIVRGQNGGNGSSTGTTTYDIKQGSAKLKSPNDKSTNLDGAGESKGNPAKLSCDSLNQAMQSLDILVYWYEQDYIPAVQANINRAPKSKDADIQRPQLKRAKEIVDSLKNQAKPNLQKLITKNWCPGTAGNPGSSKPNPAQKSCDDAKQALSEINTLLYWYEQDYRVSIYDLD